MASITQKDNGSYLIRVYCGTDDVGKQQFKSKIFRPSRKDLPYKNVRSIYFETVIEGKRALDEESVEMFEIIFDNQVMNPMTIYGWGGFSNMLNSMALASNRSIASRAAAYLNCVRINHACSELKKGRSITDICYSCGFVNPSYFIKLFRSVVGVTPMKYMSREE